MRSGIIGGFVMSIGLAPAAACSQAEAPAREPVFEMHALAPGVYAALVVPNPPAYAFANSLVVVGEDGVLVVDTQQSLTAARSLVAEVARLTARTPEAEAYDLGHPLADLERRSSDRYWVSARAFREGLRAAMERAGRS